MDNPKIKMLVPLDLIVDTDFGLIKLIQKEYRSDIFDKNVLDSDDDAIKRFLVRRTNPNPLSILTDSKDIDEYYDQFFNQRINDIYALSQITGIGQFAINALVFGDFQLYIQYTNEAEKPFAEQMKSNISDTEAFIIDKKSVVPGEYEIFVKNIMDLLTYKDLNGVNIYVSRYAFNLRMVDGKEQLAEDRFGIFFITNLLKTLDVYKGIMIYDLEEEHGTDRDNESEDG